MVSPRSLDRDIEAGGVERLHEGVLLCSEATRGEKQPIPRDIRVRTLLRTFDPSFPQRKGVDASAYNNAVMVTATGQTQHLDGGQARQMKPAEGRPSVGLCPKGHINPLSPPPPWVQQFAHNMSLYIGSPDKI